MKRCPDCRRDYYDDSLLYCLDDGSALLEGPATASGDEPATALLHSIDAAEEAPTRVQIHTTQRTAVLQEGPTDAPATKSFDKRLLFAVLALALLVIGGFAGYQYLTSKKQISSIAVLPFKNESGNEDVEYLSDGLTEALIESLSRVPHLSVKSRTSVFRYKGKQIEPQNIARELNVQAILVGRMAQRGDQLSLGLELIDSENENVIWSERYERSLTDIASLQTETARDVSDKLKLKLSEAVGSTVKPKTTDNSEAYLLYLKGRFQVAKYTREGLDLGLQYFNQAIEKDPTYANAYAGIAYNYVVAADWFLPSDEALKKAKVAANNALSIDPDHADARGTLAIVHWWNDWDPAAAEKEFRRSLELDKDNAHKHAFFGWFLVSMGRTEEGLEHNREAVRLDPLSAEMNMVCGQSYYFARRYDLAEEQLRKTLSIDKNYWMGHLVLARTLEQAGKIEEALREAKVALELENEVVEVKSLVARLQATSGNRDEANRILSELDEMSRKRFVPAYNLAEIYAALDDKERTLDLLEKAVEDRSFYLTFLRTDPVFDKVRSEPRFGEIIKRTGL